jgi:ABC-type multidrug transport system fused ATPase/permease subunit
LRSAGRRFIVLDGGRVVEQDGYDELIPKPGHFAALAARQLA